MIKEKLRHAPIAAAAIVMFLMAIALRVPSCSESLWVDELHSAWTVWGEWKDVFPRAQIGNQTPFYFAGLWWWKNAIGESELALRMTSVLATALAASIMTVGIARWSNSLIAGVAAGMVLAAESNAIFFGTELRPYAFVILASTVVVLCFIQLMSHRSADDSGRSWIGLVFLTMFAALCQPTSLGVLGWFFVLLAVYQVAIGRIRPRISITNVLLATAILAVGWTLWQNTLAASWRLRSNWASFATAPAGIEATNLWNWGWLWLAPMLLVFAPVGRWLTGDYSRRQKIAIALVGAACLLSAIAYWLASRLDWVHLWHRRYAVALLPMFAALVGAAVGRFETSNFRFPVARFVVAATLIVGLTYSQGVMQTAASDPSRLAVRGEDWRGAIRWINQHTTSSDRLFLDSGLIEQRRWVPHMYPPNWQPASFHEQYFSLPVSGPYQTRLCHPIGRTSNSLKSHIYNDARFRSQWLINVQALPAQQRRFVFLSRRPADQQDLASIKAMDRKYIDPDAVEVHGFGGVSVMVIPLAVDER
tara:strand:- start:34066 stop:35664 length:1599 start_codon:yes stop_codon:yes gene_type:complete